MVADNCRTSPCMSPLALRSMVLTLQKLFLLLHPSISFLWQEGEVLVFLIDLGQKWNYVHIMSQNPNSTSLCWFSSPLWFSFPCSGAPGIPPGSKRALILLGWWHHCDLGGWGGWFRVTPVVMDRESCESVACCNVSSLDHTSSLNKELLKIRYLY